MLGEATPYDKSFQLRIGGYPAGATVILEGRVFRSAIDDNTYEPDGRENGFWVLVVDS